MEDIQLIIDKLEQAKPKDTVVQQDVSPPINKINLLINKLDSNPSKTKKLSEEIDNVYCLDAGDGSMFQKRRLNFVLASITEIISPLKLITPFINLVVLGIFVIFCICKTSNTFFTSTAKVSFSNTNDRYDFFSDIMIICFLNSF